MDDLYLPEDIPVPPTIDAAEDICDERNAKGIGSFLAVRKIDVEDEYGLGK